MKQQTFPAFFLKRFTLFKKKEEPKPIQFKDIEMVLIHGKDYDEYGNTQEKPQIKDCINQIYNISGYVAQKQKQTFSDIIFNTYGNFMDRTFNVIKLESNLLLIWNLINFFSIFFIFNYSLFMFFIIEVAETHRYIDLSFDHGFKTFAAFILTIDCFAIRYRIRTVIRGRLVSSHAQLLKRYLKHYFVTDLIGLAIIFLDLVSIRMGYFRLVFMLKLFILFDINEQIFYKLMGHRFIIFLVKFFRLVFLIAYFTFFFAAGYVRIDLEYMYEGGYFYENGFLWLTASPSLHFQNLYEHFDWYVWFEYALFAVIQMCTGCGLGRPAPQNPLGALWYNISTITTKIMFFYFVKHVFDILSDLFYKQDWVTSKIGLINMMGSQQPQLTNQNLQRCIRYVRRTQKHQDNQMVTQQSQLLTFLSSKLVLQFKVCYKQHFFLRFLFLQQVLGIDQNKPQFNVDLSEIIKSKIVFENQKLFRKNQLNPENIYLSELEIIQIHNGAIEYKENLGEWSFVGIREFFIDKKSIFDVSATKIGMVDYLEKAKFMTIIKKNRLIYQRYCQQLDLIKIERASTQCLELRCWKCGDYHLYEHCQYLTEGMKSHMRHKKYTIHEMISFGDLERVSSHRRTIKSQKKKHIYFKALDLDNYKESSAYFSDSFNIVNE